MQFLQAVENSSVGLRGIIFFGTQGSPVVRLKRDDINRQILAQALAFRGMELMLNTVFLCARNISLVLIGLLGGLLSTISSIASMISKSNWIPFADPWHCNSLVDGIISRCNKQSLWRYQCDWFMNPWCQEAVQEDPPKQAKREGILIK